MQVLIKVLSWTIALLGLWEFGDIAALFVPGFGSIPVFVWNYILVGMILMIAGVWAARTDNAGTAKSMHWIGVAAGAWLILGTLILRQPVIAIGLWNDIIAGVLVVFLGVWAVLTTSRAAR